MENSLAEQINKVIFAAFNAKNVHIILLGMGIIFISSCKRISVSDIRLSTPIWILILTECVRFLAEREAIAFLFCANSNTFPNMPRTESIRANANNSTVNSTSGHDTATRHPILSITRYDADDLMQTTLRLGGEEALERLGLLVRHPHEDFAAEQAMRSLLNYYANVRYLCARLRGVILHAEASGARKIRRKGK